MCQSLFQSDALKNSFSQKDRQFNKKTTLWRSSIHQKRVCLLIHSKSEHGKDFIKTSEQNGNLTSNKSIRFNILNRKLVVLDKNTGSRLRTNLTVINAHSILRCKGDLVLGILQDAKDMFSVDKTFK